MKQIIATKLLIVGVFSLTFCCMHSAEEGLLNDSEIARVLQESADPNERAKIREKMAAKKRANKRANKNRSLEIESSPKVTKRDINIEKYLLLTEKMRDKSLRPEERLAAKNELEKMAKRKKDRKKLGKKVVKE